MIRLIIRVSHRPAGNWVKETIGWIPQIRKISTHTFQLLRRQCVRAFYNILRGHQFGFRTIWTNDVVLLIADKAAAYERCLAKSTNEAVVVPVTIFKWDEACATDSYKTVTTLIRTMRWRFYSIAAKQQLTGNWFGARGTTFSEELAEAIGTIRLLIATGKALSSKLNRAVSAREAFTMVWFVLVGNATAGNYLKKYGERVIKLRINRKSSVSTHISTLDTTRSEFIFITSSTIDILLARNERLGSNRCLTDATAETFLVPLTRFVFHLLRAWKILLTLESRLEGISAYFLYVPHVYGWN